MKTYIKRIMILAFTFIFTFVSLTVPKIEVKAAGNIEFFTKDAFSKMWEESTEKFEKIFYDDYKIDSFDNAYDYAKECWRVIQNTGSFVGSLGKMGGCALSDVHAFYQYLVSGHPDGAIDLIKTFNDTKIDGVTIKDGGGGIRKSDNTLSNIAIQPKQSVEIPKEEIETFRTSVMKYIEEYDGYYMYPTLTPQQFCLLAYSDSTSYKTALANINMLLEHIDSLYGYHQGTNSFIAFSFYKSTEIKEYIISGKYLAFYLNDWTNSKAMYKLLYEKRFNYTWDDINNAKDGNSYIYDDSYYSILKSDNMSFQIIDSYGQIEPPRETWACCIITKDGHYVKIWKNADAPKNAELNIPRAYCTNVFNQNTVVNSISGDTFNGCNIVTDYNNIQTQINGDNVQNADTIINNYYSSGSGGSGGSGNGSDDGNGGNSPSGWDVIQSLTEGLGSLLGVIATLIGNVMKIVGDLLQTFLDTLDNLLSLLTGGFADFLTAAFPFIPEEIWTTIILGIEVMVIVAVIKAVRS